MAALALFALLLASGPQPTDGPALPIAMLREAKLVKVTVSTSWANGLYSVSFQYRSDKSVPELAPLLLKDSFRANIAGAPSNDGYQASRSKDGVSQSVILSRAVPHKPRVFKGADTLGKPFTSIYVSETTTREDRPARWYKGAISPNPPVPLIDVPFLRGVKCDAVSLESFEGLMSSKGLNYTGTDAALFSAKIDRPPAEVQAALVAWASANGYTKTYMGSYFKPGVRLFEIYLRPSAKEPKCWVTLYATDRQVTHPIVWEKF